jgi:hypothetical protein
MRGAGIGIEATRYATAEGFAEGRKCTEDYKDLNSSFSAQSDAQRNLEEEGMNPIFRLLPSFVLYLPEHSFQASVICVSTSTLMILDHLRPSPSPPSPR